MHIIIMSPLAGGESLGNGLRYFLSVKPAKNAQSCLKFFTNFCNGGLLIGLDRARIYTVSAMYDVTI